MKLEKLDNGLKISSSELCESFITSEVEPRLFPLAADKNGGEMEDEAENGS